jgi:hypothetical protein
VKVTVKKTGKLGKMGDAEWTVRDSVTGWTINVYAADGKTAANKGATQLARRIADANKQHEATHTAIVHAYKTGARDGADDRDITERDSAGRYRIDTEMVNRGTRFLRLGIDDVTSPSLEARKKALSKAGVIPANRKRNR